MSATLSDKIAKRACRGKLHPGRAVDHIRVAAGHQELRLSCEGRPAWLIEGLAPAAVFRPTREQLPAAKS
jgi:hypothetical protein